MLTVRCPDCKNDMRYDPKLGAKRGVDVVSTTAASSTILGKKKRCVYCGHTFTVHPDQTRSCVVAPGVLDVHNAHLFQSGDRC